MGLMKQILIKSRFEKQKAEKILHSSKEGAYQKKDIKPSEIWGIPSKEYLDAVSKPEVKKRPTKA
jgi:hypothetical protein